ncbi:MAG: cyclic nucleotide-binding domain-containing protein [Rhabdochlamydiaceae bacterium]
MDQEEFIFLKNINLFNGLEDQDLMDIIQFVEKASFKKGDFIFKEGDPSDSLYVICKGSAQILKLADDKKSFFNIQSLSEGQIIGEMGFIDDMARSASVKALSDMEVLKLKRESFNLENALAKKIHNQIVTNISKTTISRLRDTGNNLVASLKSEKENLENQNKFGHFFIWLMVLFGIGAIFDEIAKQKIVDVRNGYYSWAYLISLVLPFIVIIRVYKFSFSDAGLSFKNFKKSLIQGFVISALLVILFVSGVDELLKEVIQKHGLLKTPRPLDLVSLLYLPHSFIQEFISRGVAQTAFQKFYSDKKGLKSVMITSFIFAVFHLHISFTAALLVFLASLLFGFIYIRSYNLVGVTIVHFVIGTLGKYLGVF